MGTIRAAITGVGGYVPEHVLTNADLEAMVDTNDEWIVKRTGIRERRILKDKDKASSYMGTQAVLGLLKKKNIHPDEIDIIICATNTPDMTFPATANLIAAQVGIRHAFCFDVQAACSGFLFAVFTASQYIETGKFRKIIVLGVEKMSSIVDYSDRSTCILFGDGGGAVLLEPSDNGYGLQDAVMHSNGEGLPYLNLKAGGSLYPTSIETLHAHEHYLYQEGSAVFKFAVKSMAGVCQEVLDRNKLSVEDITWFVPHQANLRIIQMVGKATGIDAKRTYVNIDRLGNVSAASLPLCLWEMEKMLKKGDHVVFTVFGGGFSWGAMYIRWGYNAS